MAVAALLAGHTIRSVKRMDEYVTVKGLSEREVPADLAIWPIAFTIAENDLTLLQGGFRPPGRRFRSSSPRAVSRRRRFPTGCLRSPMPRRLRQRRRVEAGLPLSGRHHGAAPQRQGGQGQERDGVLGQTRATGDRPERGDYQSKPQFLFTGLNQIKPDMIQEANRNARKAAERFAADSNSPVGAVRHAIQGPFEINDLDSSSPDRKIVRVVTTVDFYLR